MIDLSDVIQLVHCIVSLKIWASYAFVWLYWCSHEFGQEVENSFIQNVYQLCLFMYLSVVRVVLGTRDGDKVALHSWD